MAYDYPDTGNDYDTLARLTQPQMMGNAPIGAGGLAGMMYGQDVARHDAMLEQSMNLADLNASMKRQAAGEYMSGAPGRSADIQAKNQMSMGNLGNIGALLDTQKNKAETGDIESKTAKVQALKSQLYSYVTDWTQAKTPEAKQAVREQMDADGIKKLGNVNLADVTDEQIDGAMQRLRQEMTQTPKHIQAMELEKAKGEDRAAALRVTADARVRAAEIRAKTASNELEFKRSIASVKPENESQWMAAQLKQQVAKLVDKGMDPDEARDQVLLWYAKYKIAQHPQPQNPTVDPNVAPGIIVPPKQNVPPPIPQAGSVEHETKSFIQTKEGYAVDPKSGTANKDGKIYAIKSTVVNNGTTKGYILSDGTRVNLK